MQSETSPSAILEFWYSERIAPHWFASTRELDEEIRARYAALWRSAAKGGLDAWCDTPEGSLALVIVLDQFPLNMFRGTPASFSTEVQAIRCAKRAIEQGFDQRLELDRRAFLYMPLMHSECLADQYLSVRLLARAGLKSNLAFAEHHREIIRRFGRFPHRNQILGRRSTADELAYLASSEAFKG